ncbi:class I SAM-dependent methyltransferase [Streptomyces brasiliscabiei]|uniref:class I SAM-dependent methyltransferase n=1 Tax=Streptomyces brasiliscabiei TaxID=2736302 RepID=UPI001F3FA572|nr:class I SAM-dependent methyltransferase [Streptomyces brasiliscabiei]
MGKYAARLVREHGAVVDAVETSPTQHERAVTRHGTVPGLNLIHADAVEYLKQAEPYDVIYSIHAFGYIDPHRLLPAVAAALRPDGRLFFSVLHTNAAGRSPFQSVAAHPEVLPLAGGEPLAVQMWVLGPTLWEDLLVEYGFLVDKIDVLDAPEDSNPVSCWLFRVRQRARPTVREHASRRPVSRRRRLTGWSGPWTSPSRGPWRSCRQARRGPTKIKLWTGLERVRCPRRQQGRGMSAREGPQLTDAVRPGGLHCGTGPA